MKALLFLLAGVSSWAWAVDSPPLSPSTENQSGYEFELLPRGRLFRLTFADPREIRMALSVQGQSRIDAYVGNYFSILGYGGESPTDWQMHFGLEGAGYFTMRQQGSRFPLETTDGLLGLYLEASKERWQFQMRYTHVSAHLSDGSSDTPIQYSREHLNLRAGYLIRENWHVYSGLRQIVNSVPSVPGVSLQLGSTYFLPIHLGKITPYAGFDFQYRKESTVNPSFGLQLGVALNNPPRAYHSFRFFYSYYTGSDPRGQYFDRSLSYHSFGVEMQI